MKVTINLARHSGNRELVQVLRAAEAVKPSRRSHLNLYNPLILTVEKIVDLGIKLLEGFVERTLTFLCSRSKAYWNRLKAFEAG